MGSKKLNFVNPKTLREGDHPEIGGCVLRLSDIRGRLRDEVEQRLGYRPGRLLDGWWLLFLLEVPLSSQFELFGYTHMSGGKFADSDKKPEEALRAKGVSDAWIAETKESVIKKYLTVLPVPERIVKIIPMITDNEDEAAFPPGSGVNRYPPGQGILQWRLTDNLKFAVKSFIDGGHAYVGDWGDPK